MGLGNDIDVYLQSLVKKLKKLWDGIDIYDITSKETFKMQAALLWTISDFPSLSTLFGQSTQGWFACPCCGESTYPTWLANGKKFCYMGHRWWLDETHNFHFQTQLLDGTVDQRVAPVPLTRDEVLKKFEGLTFTYGKVTKKSKQVMRKRMRGENVAQVEEGDEDLGEVGLWRREVYSLIFYIGIQFSWDII